MKLQLKIVLVLIFAFIVGFGAVAQNVPVDDETPIALVKKIVRDVKYKEADQSDWELAKTGEPLAAGGEVKTGFKSLALVLFTDGSGLLRVQENSILHIYGNKEERQINKNTFIEKGIVGFEVSKQEDEEFKFTTPTMVASIRGTDGYLDHENDNSGSDCSGISTLVINNGLAEFQTTCGDQRSGSVGSGNFVTVSGDGNVNEGQMSDEQRQQLGKTQQTNTKKIRVETEEGTLEIEYYPEENEQ